MGEQTRVGGLGDGEIGGTGDGETKRRGDGDAVKGRRGEPEMAEHNILVDLYRCVYPIPSSSSPLLPDSPYPRLPVAPSRHFSVSQSPPLPVSPSPHLSIFPSSRLLLSHTIALLALFSLIAVNTNGFAQGGRSASKGSHSRSVPETMSAETRELVERAIDVICSERKKDPKGSHPIDEMQARASLPVYSAEAVAGGARAQRLLPVAKQLVVTSIQRLTNEYKLHQTKGYDLNIKRAIGRVQQVKRVKPDMASRDNASVFLKRPQTITFGTIFLAGLPSDEAMISVLAHELMHLADGDRDSLRSLFRAVGSRASSLTGMRIYQQRAEELTCDLVGAITARSFISDTPDYSPLNRRISRAVQHNCVEDDEGDEDHLSPRNTIRALLALSPGLAYELVYGL